MHLFNIMQHKRFKIRHLWPFSTNFFSSKTQQQMEAHVWSVHCSTVIQNSSQGSQTDVSKQGYNNPPVPRVLAGQNHIPPCQQHTQTLVTLCKELGWKVNMERSDKQAISARERALCQLTVCFEFQRRRERRKGQKSCALQMVFRSTKLIVKA